MPCISRLYVRVRGPAVYGYVREGAGYNALENLRKETK